MISYRARDKEIDIKLRQFRINLSVRLNFVCNAEIRGIEEKELNLGFR